MARELAAIKPKAQYLPHFAYMTLWQRVCPTSGQVGSPRRRSTLLRFTKAASSVIGSAKMVAPLCF